MHAHIVFFYSIHFEEAKNTLHGPKDGHVERSLNMVVSSANDPLEQYRAQ